MAEIKTECIVFKIKLICDQCEQGEMLLTNIVYPTYPPCYEHRCNYCHHIKSSAGQYPKIVYEDKK